MEIRSAKKLNIENCLSLSIYVVFDEDTDSYLSTFELFMPEEEIDIAQYDALIEGIAYTQYKMDQLMTELELIDEDSNDDE